MLRLLATPVVIALIMLWGASWFTFVFGGLLALSDGIDGWVARKQGTTRSGAFLDPLADKVVVLGALVALVAKGDRLVAAGGPHRRPGGRHERLPLGGRSPGCLHPGPQLGQGQDPAPGHGHRHVPGPAAGRPQDACWPAAIWVATALTVVHRWPVLPRRPPGRPHAPPGPTEPAVDGASSAA